MLRLPDFYTRVHAQTVIIVGGVMLALLGIAVKYLSLEYSLKILIIILILILTTPTSAHAISKAAKKSGIEPWRHE